MGSGKTTTGKKLAAMLGWAFTDLDRSIEKHTGMSIPQIFSDKGEAYFREIESDMLRKQYQAVNTVISTGGGAPVYDDNMDYMLKTGLTIYLKLTPGQLKTRLAASDGERPLIRNLTENELLGYIEEKLHFREKWYCRAELTVSGFDTDMRAIYSAVRSRLSL